VLTVIMTITGRFICSANSYCDNNICSVSSYCDINVEIYMQCYHIVTITGRSMCSANSDCDNNGEVYMQY
jgi:hypothetical protein